MTSANYPFKSCLCEGNLFPNYFAHTDSSVLVSAKVHIRDVSHNKQAHLYDNEICNEI